MITLTADNVENNPYSRSDNRPEGEDKNKDVGEAENDQDDE